MDTDLSQVKTLLSRYGSSTLNLGINLSTDVELKERTTLSISEVCDLEKIGDTSDESFQLFATQIHQGKAWYFVISDRMMQPQVFDNETFNKTFKFKEVK